MVSIGGFFLGNLTIALVMVAFSLSWDALAALRGRGRIGEALHTYRPSRTEWSAFYWRRARTYLFSYLFVLALFVLLPWFLGRRQMILGQLISVAYLLPGLLGYFFLAGLIPPRITFYSEGFRCSALVPFLPGRRNYEAKTFSAFGVGVRFWRDYRDALPRGEVLILRKDDPPASTRSNRRRAIQMGTELVIPHGERDRLLNLTREGLKKAKEERRQSKKDRRPRATKAEE